MLPAKIVIWFQTVFHSFILFIVGIPGRSFVFTWTQIQRPYRFPEIDYFAVTTVNFLNNIVFIFTSHSIFRFTKYFTQSVFSVESGSYFVRSEYKS